MKKKGCQGLAGLIARDALRMQGMNTAIDKKLPPPLLLLLQFFFFCLITNIPFSSGFAVATI
jgi:hypothetical protein